jgi:hypothetical protein
MFFHACLTRVLKGVPGDPKGVKEMLPRISMFTTII